MLASTDEDTRVLVCELPVPAKLARREFYVYTLADPADDIIRYVGCTSQLVGRRRTHLSMRGASSGSKLAAWFDDLRQRGARPVFEVQTVAFGAYAHDAARRAERALIRDLARDGESGELLCNVAGNPRGEGRRYWST